MSVGGDDCDIIDHNLMDLAGKKLKKEDTDENFDWENDDLVSIKSDKYTKRTRLASCIRAYMKLSPLSTMLISVIYGTCILLIFFLFDFIFFIEEKKGNWKYWQSSLVMIKGYPLFIWTIFIEIVWCSFFILRYFFYIFPNILLRLSDIILGTITEVFRHYTIDYIKYLNKYISFTIWVLICSISFENIFVNKKQWALSFKKFLWWGFIASVIWLIEKVLFQTFAMSFHKKAFDERIKKIKYSISVLEKFYKIYTQEEYEEALASEDEQKGSRFFLFEGVKKLQRMVGINHGNNELIVRNSSDAKRLAKSIFEYLRPSEEIQFLTLEDFKPFFETDDQAQKAFDIFDVDKNGDISKYEIKNVIICIYREKEAIEKSMRDSGQALGKLDSLMKSIAIVIMALTALAIASASGYSSLMLSIGTIWVSTMFAVSGIITTVVENIIFLFISHPFDVGDKIQIGTDVMYVIEFGLICTVFKRTDGKKLYCPNKLISNQFIRNVRRSGTIVEEITLEVAVSTTKAQLEQLKSKIIEFLEEHKNEFSTKADVAFKSLLDVGHMNIGIMIEHTINFQDTIKYNIRRNELMLTISRLLNELGISLYHENSYDVRLSCSNPNTIPLITKLCS